MKLHKSLLIFLILCCSAKVFAEDFTAKVIVPTPDNANISIAGPQKSNTGFSVTVKITNNKTATSDDNQKYFISFDAFGSSLPGTLKYTITYPTPTMNRLSLTAGQSDVFVFTFTPTADLIRGGNDYSLTLAFTASKATDFTEVDFTIPLYSLVLWVDNIAPTIDASAASTSVSSTTMSVWGISFNDDDHTPNAITPTLSIAGVGNFSYSNSIYSISGLTPNTNYCVNITAKDRAGNVTTNSSICRTTAPLAPTISSSSSTLCSITLNWPASPGATTYKLYNSSNALIGSTSATSYTVNGLTPGNSYKYYVVAIGNAGTSNNGPIYTASTSAIPAVVFSDAPDFMCKNSTQTVSINSLPGNVSYTWIPSSSLAVQTEGFGTTYGSGETTVSIRSGSVQNMESLKVEANFVCGGQTFKSTSQTYSIPVNYIAPPTLSVPASHGDYLKCSENLIAGYAGDQYINYYYWQIVGNGVSAYFTVPCTGEGINDDITTTNRLYLSSDPYQKITWPITVYYSMHSTLCGGFNSPMVNKVIPYNSSTLKSAEVPANSEDLMDFQSISIDAGSKNINTNFETYPNPAISILNVKVPQGSVSLSIYDMEGKQMYMKNLTSAEDELKISVSSFKEGLYLVRLIGDGITQTKKITIKK